MHWRFRRHRKVGQVENIVANETPVATHSSEDHGGGVVTFEHVNSLSEVKVHAGKDETLLALWDEAYVELKEPRRPDDRLQTDDGVDLMPHLGLTLEALRQQLNIKTKHFQIVGPTGGA